MSGMNKMQADRNQKALHELAAKPGNSECCVSYTVEFLCARGAKSFRAHDASSDLVTISPCRLVVSMAMKVVRKSRTCSTKSSVTHMDS